MENFNFLKKKEVVPSANVDTSKEASKDKINNLSTLDGKRSFIEQNGIHSFEDWSKKTFDEKLSILSKLDAMPDNFNHFEKNTDISNFKQESIETIQELDRDFDFYMRVTQFPGYKEQTELLYQEESKNLAGESEHKYPEEILDIKPDVLEAYNKQEERGEYKKGEHDYIFSPINALKNGGVKNLSEWYSKSIDEKRKILMSSPDFMGVDIEVKKGKIPLTLLYGKEKYIGYLDQCFYSTIYRISEVLRWQNQSINEDINKDELLKKAKLNQERNIEEKFKQKVIEAQEILDENRKKIITDMHESIDEKLPNLSSEDRNEIKDYLESTNSGDDKEFKT